MKEDPTSESFFANQTATMGERAAICLRVSIDEGEQSEENQRRELDQFIEAEGYKLAGEYVDHESG